MVLAVAFYNKKLIESVLCNEFVFCVLVLVLSMPSALQGKKLTRTIGHNVLWSVF